MMSIGLHCRLVGRPSRAATLGALHGLRRVKAQGLGGHARGDRAPLDEGASGERLSGFSALLERLRLTHCSMPAAFIRPDWRAISLPWLNRIMVGMPWMPKRPASCLLLVGVDLGEADPGLELARRLLELRRHGLAGPAPWRPEVDQQRDVALGSVGLEALGVQRHGMTLEQRRAALAAFAAAPAASFSRGARFRVLQAGQATIRESDMAHLFARRIMPQRATTLQPR